MSELYVKETYEDEKFRVKIINDFDPESPRNWNNLGTMVCWHPDYNLGDGHDFKNPDEFLEWWKEEGGGGMLLPLYLYDHSGITISTDPFSCPWDSGQVGWIYCKRETILHEWSRKHLSKKLLQLVVRNLKKEVETYDQYLTGDIWGFKIEDAKDESHIDSCWGFYGGDPKENGMWDYWSEDIRKLVDPTYQINPKSHFLNQQHELFVA